MNYDRIIVELLNRVSILEEEVNKLKNNKLEDNNSSNNKEVSILDTFKDPNIRPTDRAVSYIKYKIETAKENNEEYVDIVALEVEHAIGTKMRSPLVCSAMRKDYGCEREVLVDTASHNSTTYTVRYFIK